jgi:threonyl-tRNA synthetase
VLPVTDRAVEYADAQLKKLRAAGLRAEVDRSDERLQKKIRTATLEKVPYMLVVGDRDIDNATVSPRLREGDTLDSMTIEAFIERANAQMEDERKGAPGKSTKEG